MARYSGLVGFRTEDVEKAPGIFTQAFVEKPMRGEVVTSRKQYIQGNQAYDDSELSNQISLVGSQFSYENYTNIKYLTYLGRKWKVISAAVEHPRIIVTLGGLYNEK